MLIARQLIIIPTAPSLTYVEQSINNVIVLRQFLQSIDPIFQALAGAQSVLLANIRKVIYHAQINDLLILISFVLQLMSIRFNI